MNLSWCSSTAGGMQIVHYTTAKILLRCNSLVLLLPLTKNLWFSCIKITQGVISHVFCAITSFYIVECLTLTITLALKQTCDYDAWPEVLGEWSSWLICWYSQRADMASVNTRKKNKNILYIYTHTHGTPPGLHQPWQTHWVFPTCPGPIPVAPWGWQTTRQHHWHSPAPLSSSLWPYSHLAKSTQKHHEHTSWPFGKGDQCSALRPSPCQTPQMRKAKPSSEDMDLHRPRSFYSWHP